MNNFDTVGALRASLERLTIEANQVSLSAPRRRKLEAQIKEAIDGLMTLLARLDPIAQPTSVFDPSNPKVVGRFVALALVAQDAELAAHFREHPAYPRFGSGAGQLHRGTASRVRGQPAAHRCAYSTATTHDFGWTGGWSGFPAFR